MRYDDWAAEEAEKRREKARAWLAEYFGYYNPPPEARASYEADLDKWTRKRHARRAARGAARGER